MGEVERSDDDELAGDELDDGGAEHDADDEHDDEPHACPRHPNAEVRGTCTRCGGFFCAVCLREADRPLQSGRCPNCEAEPAEARTMGGWLVLPAIGLVVTFGQTLWIALGELGALDTDVPGLAPLIVAELLVYLFLAGLTAFAAYHFFQKKKRAISLMIAFYAAGFVVTLFDVGAVLYLESVIGVAQELDGPQVLRGLVMPLVWIAYFTNSQRVRETFVYD